MGIDPHRHTDQLLQLASQRQEILDPIEIEVDLMERGIRDVVAMECSGELERRARLKARAERRRDRQRASKFGRRGDAYRRVIATRFEGGRERQYHATKGWRDYRQEATTS